MPRAPKPGEPPAASVDLSEGAPSGLVDVPVVNLFPNAVKPAVDIANPYADDPDSAVRGMKDFIQFNCVGCHAANGAGGMGPSLSDADFIYGSEPQNIFLSIYQGRPAGMPAWGGSLPPRSSGTSSPTSPASARRPAASGARPSRSAASRWSRCRPNT